MQQELIIMSGLLYLLADKERKKGGHFQFHMKVFVQQETVLYCLFLTLIVQENLLPLNVEGKDPVDESCYIFIGSQVV